MNISLRISFTPELIASANILYLDSFGSIYLLLHYGDAALDRIMTVVDGSKLNFRLLWIDRLEFVDCC